MNWLRKRSVPAALTMAVSMAVLSPAQADKGVLLRYKFEKGEPLVYRSTSEIEQNQSVADMEIKTTITSREVTARSLDRVDDDGNFVLQFENRELAMGMKISGPMELEYKYDSKSSERDKASQIGAAITPAMEAMTGAIINVTLSTRGDVEKVEGLKELLAGVLPENNPFTAQFAAGATDEGAKVQYSEHFVELPEKPVEPGDTWEVPYDVTLPGLGTAKGKNSYKFEGMEKSGDRDVAKISSSTEFSFDVDLDQMGAKVTGSVSTTSASGTILFDPATGRIISKKAKNTFSGNLTVNAGGQTIPVQQSTTQMTHLELVDKASE